LGSIVDVSVDNRGAILLFVSFVMTAVAVLCVAYWNIIKFDSRIFFLKEKSIQAFFAARGGIDDAIYEIREGHAWEINSVSDTWYFLEGKTFFKSTSQPNRLEHFDYPTSIFVTVDGDPGVGRVTITSKAQVATNSEPGQKYEKTLEAIVVRSVSGEVFILEIQEI
jgi:hypothetical protein